jgi:hypothetical protein
VLLASGTALRSPWSAPPIPGGDERDVLQDTDEGDYSASSADASASQMSQGTSPVASAETAPMRTGKSRPLPTASPASPTVLTPTALVVLTLAISVPLSMLVGALVASLAFWIWQ